MENKTVSVVNTGAVSSALYVSFQVIANVLSTKIAVLPLLSWPIDGGTIIYPLTFTLRDFVHKSLGKKQSRVIVLLAAGVNLLAALLFLVVAKVQPDASWPYQQAYENILLPVWRITWASIVAQVISELLDTELFSAIYRRFSDAAAVFVSNSVALVLDSVVFSLVAFAGALPLSVVFQVAVTNIIVKFILSVVSVPTIKFIPRTARPEEI